MHRLFSCNSTSNWSPSSLCTSTMIATAALDASGQEDTMTWFTPIGLTYLGEYLSYGIHVLWLLLPFILLYSIILPFYSFMCISNLLLYIYKKKNNLHGDVSSKSWDKARKAIAYVMSSFAKIWHGYEIIGMENLPEGAGLIIYYHGVLAIDYGYFVATLYWLKERVCHSLTDNLLLLTPGVQLYREVVSWELLNKAECVELLKKGNLLGIAPGGLREQNFSDNYNLIWGNRTGFAQVALEAKVPIIPLFTQNIREGYWTVGNTRLSRWVYERARWLVLPVYGGLPVKLCTYIGEPIPYDPNITAKELAEKTKTAIENLINQHQKRPGNKMKALWERFDKHHKDN